MRKRTYNIIPVCVCVCACLGYFFELSFTSTDAAAAATRTETPYRHPSSKHIQGDSQGRFLEKYNIYIYLF